MYKDDYRAALGKLTPSDEWKKETLRKMHELETEQAQRASQEEPKEKRVLPFGVRVRRAALPAAAALVLMLTPLTSLRGCGASGGAAAMPPAAMDAVPYAQNDAPDEGAGYGKSADGIEEYSSAATAAAEEKEQAQDSARSGDPAAGSIAGLLAVIPADGSTKFTFTQDAGGMGGVNLIVKTPDARELAGTNPTRDLPGAELPAALPVYRAVTDEQEMFDVLQETADLLGEEIEEFSHDPIPQEALDAGVAWRNIPAFAHTKSKISLSFLSPSVHFYSYNADTGNVLRKAPADWQSLSEEELRLYYYENYGKALQPLENPAVEIKGDYTYDGEYWEQPAVFYEAGSEDDPIETRLYNYSFRRIMLYPLKESGDLSVVDYTVQPEAVGLCELRTLDEAREALENGEGWQNGSSEAGGYDGGSLNVLHWEIVYHDDPCMDTIQPVYRFTVDAPDAEKPSIENASGEAYKYVAYIYVPALRPEYLTEQTFAHTYN